MSRRAAVEGWPFSFLDTVRYGDLDANRHLNNVVYLQFFEDARIAYVASLVPGRDVAQSEDFGLIFAEAHINYRAPAFYDETIRTWIRPFALRRSSFRMAFRMVAEGDGRLLGEGWGALVGYDYKNGKAVPLIAELVDALRRAGAADTELDDPLDPPPPPAPPAPATPPASPDPLPDLEA